MNDLTKGNPLKLLLFFSMPMLLSMLFQQMYNMVDSMIAGQFIGTAALAAIGASTPIVALFIAVANGSSFGSAVVISQLYGRGDRSRVKTGAYTALLSLLVISLSFTVLGLLLCTPMLHLIDTPVELFGQAASYLRISILGLPFLFLYNAANSIFNGLGDSRTPLYFLILSSITNVVLDYVFVRYLAMGVAGLALATLLAQAMSSLLSVGVLLHRMKAMPSDADIPVKYFDKTMLPMMARIAIPSICQSSFVSVGNFMVQGLINSYGEVTIAAFSSALKINTFVLACMGTMSGALTSFTSQNIGAGRIDRVITGFKMNLTIALPLITVVSIGVWVYADQLLMLFLSGDNVAAVLEEGRFFLKMLACSFWMPVIKNNCDAVLRGGGSMREFMATTFADLLIRLIFSYAFARLLGFHAVCWAYVVGWVIGTAMAIVFYRRGNWKTMKI